MTPGAGHQTWERLSLARNLGIGMGNDARLRVKLHPGEAMTLTRVSVNEEKLVYVLLAGRKRKYTNGRSRVVYIGTTKRGIQRIASSVASKAGEILAEHGVRELHVRIITCRPRPRVKTWLKLERALLLTFREIYGQIPLYNQQGKKMREDDEFLYFGRTRVRGIVKSFES